MRVTIWDGWLGKVYRVIDDDRDSSYWEYGNGSCDCNRVISYSKEMKLLEKQKGPGICYGCRRFVIVDVDGKSPTHEMNMEYDPGMVELALQKFKEERCG